MKQPETLSAVGSTAWLGARPNVALAISTSEWSERYRRALRQLCKIADDEALNPDNSIAMQSRMMGESPEATARCVADEIEAWANESAPNVRMSHPASEI
jgi:hypothetical protein